MCNIYGSHHHPNYWTRPDRFDPMRFSVSKDRAQHRLIHPYSFRSDTADTVVLVRILLKLITMTIAAKLVAAATQTGHEITEIQYECHVVFERDAQEF